MINSSPRRNETKINLKPNKKQKISTMYFMRKKRSKFNKEYIKNIWGKKQNKVIKHSEVIELESYLNLEIKEEVL